jgi:hypothetical protein
MNFKETPGEIRNDGEDGFTWPTLGATGTYMEE